MCVHCTWREKGEQHPISFVLHGSEYLDNWFGKGFTYKIKLSGISPDSVSFSLGDSCAQYGKSGNIHQLTAKQLLSQINEFEGSTDDFMKYVSEHSSYIEVHLWDDSVIREKILQHIYADELVEMPRHYAG